MKQFLTAAEVARLLKVDRATVTRWIQKGQMRDVYRSAQSHEWRIPLSSYAELLKEKSGK
jgi:excisionase family DNA binding protein